MGNFFESLWESLSQSLKDGELVKSFEEELASQLAEQASSKIHQANATVAQLSAVGQCTSSCSSDSDPEISAKRRIRGLLSYDTYGLDLAQPKEAKKRRKDDRTKSRFPIGVIIERQRLFDADTKLDFDTQAIVTSVFDLTVKGENLEKRKLGRKIPKIRALDQPLGWRFL